MLWKTLLPTASILAAAISFYYAFAAVSEQWVRVFWLSVAGINVWTALFSLAAWLKKS